MIYFAQGLEDSEIFCKQVKHFVRYTKVANKNTVLLVLDGYGSLEYLQFEKKRCFLFCFPAHCSHRTQPLEVRFYRLLTYFDQEI